MKDNMLISQLPHWNLTNKRVFLRADLNVPIQHGTIVNDFKLKSIVPTLDLLLKQHAAVVLASHLGRPKGFDPELSTKPLGAWLETHGYQVQFIPYKEHNPFNEVRPAPGNIVLLDNMRFYPGEQTHEMAPLFAQQLASLADYYVHDAFALMHRTDTSVTAVPRLFDASHRTIGLLVEKEVNALSKLVHNPEKPFVLIIGGGKVADKIPLLTGMLDRVTHILLCPAIVFTFLKTENRQTGKSLVDNEQIASVKTFMELATKKGVELIFPIDYQVAQGTLNGPLSVTSADNFPIDGVGMSIGPQTAQLFATYITAAKTVFFNGLPGITYRPETLQGAHAIFQAMAQAPGFTVIGGGDSVAAAESLVDVSKISYCSTGGGATLSYLAHKTLPGLELFEGRKD
jgi:phosphoglycerate kinase